MADSQLDEKMTLPGMVQSFCQSVSDQLVCADEFEFGISIRSLDNLPVSEVNVTCASRVGSQHV